MNKLVESIQIAPNGGFVGFGRLGNLGGSNGISLFTTFLSSIIGLITIIGIIWFIFLIIIGAIGIMTSGGDKASAESARKRIINGLIGLIILIVGLFIVSLIGYLLGIPDILNLKSLFETIIGNGLPVGGPPVNPPIQI